MEIENDTDAIHTANEMVTCALAIKFVGEESRTIDVIASTDRIDTHGEVVLQEDWGLERVKGVGVPVFYNHNMRDLPIGKVTQAAVVDGRLRASLQLATADVNPESERVWRAVKGGLIGAVSVGFMPGKLAIKEREGKKVLTLGQPELIEISLTATPANSDAAIMRLRSKALAAPEPPQAPSEPNLNTGANGMKTLLNELGLTDADSEDEALKIVRSMRARVANHDQVLDVIAMTGCTDSDQVVSVINAYKSAAERVPGLEAQVETLTKDADRIQRESLVEKIMTSKKATPHQRNHYLPSLSVKELRLFLETAPRIGPLSGKVEEPEQDTKESLAAKQWKAMPPIERARLYQEDLAAYTALKKAAGE